VSVPVAVCVCRFCSAVRVCDCATCKRTQSAQTRNKHNPYRNTHAQPPNQHVHTHTHTHTHTNIVAHTNRELNKAYAGFIPLEFDDSHPHLATGSLFVYCLFCFVCLFVVCFCVCLFVYLFICLFIYTFVVYLFVCSFLCLFVRVVRECVFCFICWLMFRFDVKFVHFFVGFFGCVGCLFFCFVFVCLFLGCFAWLLVFSSFVAISTPANAHAHTRSHIRSHTYTSTHTQARTHTRTDWGCGAFNGDVELKSMLQWIAACEVCACMCVCDHVCVGVHDAYVRAHCGSMFNV